MALMSQIWIPAVDEWNANNRSPRADVFSVLARGFEDTVFRISGPFWRILVILRIMSLLVQHEFHQGVNKTLSQTIARDHIHGDDVDIDAEQFHWRIHVA